MDISKIKFNPLDPQIFGDIAKNCADEISKSSGKNESSQIRKFYDELVMWHDKIQHADDLQQAYKENEPFIQMMKAKVAYAKGRKLLDDNFEQMFNQIMKEIKDPQSLNYAKLFFEAVLGFRKALEKGK